jgi:glycosyltransferase involved in cell wall biosynthesis
VPCGQLARLADLVQALAGDAARRQRMGAAAKARAATQFAYDRMLDRIESLYGAVMTPRMSPGGV